MDKSVAIAHEHFPEIGGGEHVAIHLSKVFDAPIYTGFVGDGIDPGQFDKPLVDLFGTGLMGTLLKRDGMLANVIRDAYYQFAWTNVDELYDYDVIIQSGNNPGWFVPNVDNQVVVKYTHSPPRNPYDLYSTDGNGWLNSIYTKAARLTYPQTISYPDVIVANSEVVDRRIKRYLGVSDDRVRVVYPPTDVGSYSHTDADTQDYYLTYSRLREAKQIKWIAAAFADRDERLVIGGKGPQADAIRELADANKNIEYVGYMSEREKRRRLSEAKALVFAARNEDFGMVPIEAFAAGTPVLGVNEGFTRYQIEDGETGYTFERETHSLHRAIDTFEADGVRYPPGGIEAHAIHFSTREFEKGMQQAVSDAIEHAKITPKFNQ